MTTLDQVQTGDTVKVSALLGAGAIKRRIMDMGLTKGTKLYVRKVAPLGDPVEITVRGYELSLRKGEAEHVEVEMLTGLDTATSTSSVEEIAAEARESARADE